MVAISRSNSSSSPRYGDGVPVNSTSRFKRIYACRKLNIFVALIILAITTGYHHDRFYVPFPFWNKRANLKEARKTLSNAVEGSKTIPTFDAGGLPLFYKRKIPKTKQRYDVCIVGAGLSGSVIAERYANVLDQTLLVMEVRTHIGGNCYDFKEPFSGITQEEMDTWLKSVQIPCGTNGCQNAEEMAKSRVGQDLFDLVFKTYTMKQWDKEPKDLDALVTARIP
eukprot:scaffold166324_cov49-Attheya_sp.AAC.2